MVIADINDINFLNKKSLKEIYSKEVIAQLYPSRWVDFTNSQEYQMDSNYVLRNTSNGHLCCKISSNVKGMTDCIFNDIAIYNIKKCGDVYIGLGHSINSSPYSSNCTVYASTDCINWTRQSASGDSFAYGNGKIVVTCSSSQYIYISSDGFSWNHYYAPNYSLSNITFGNGLFLLSKEGDSRYYTSENGSSWTERTFSNYYYSNIMFGNGVFVIRVSGGAIYYSSNGINWNICSASTNSNIITFGNGVFVAGEMVSENGISWSGGGTDSWFSDYKGCFISNNLLYSSINGKDWSKTYTGTSVRVYGESISDSDTNTFSIAFEKNNPTVYKTYRNSNNYNCIKSITPEVFYTSL